MLHVLFFCGRLRKKNTLDFFVFVYCSVSCVIFFGSDSGLSRTESDARAVAAGKRFTFTKHVGASSFCVRVAARKGVLTEHAGAFCFFVFSFFFFFYFRS